MADGKETKKDELQADIVGVWVYGFIIMLITLPIVFFTALGLVILFAIISDIGYRIFRLFI